MALLLRFFGWEAYKEVEPMAGPPSDSSKMPIFKNRHHELPSFLEITWSVARQVYPLYRSTKSVYLQSQSDFLHACTSHEFPYFSKCIESSLEALESSGAG